MVTGLDQIPIVLVSKTAKLDGFAYLTLRVGIHMVRGQHLAKEERKELEEEPQLYMKSMTQAVNLLPRGPNKIRLDFAHIKIT